MLSVPRLFFLTLRREEREESRSRLGIDNGINN